MSVIAFHGCSFTWGAGLHNYYLREHKQYTNKQLIELEKQHLNLEHFPKEVDDYRKENHFPNLVAEHFNVPYILSLQGNGGDNESIFERIETPFTYHNECAQLHVIQLSAPARGNLNWNELEGLNLENPDDLIEMQIESIIFRLKQNITNSTSTKILFLCWFVEHAEYIQTNYPDLLIPIICGKNTYDSFDVFINRSNIEPFSLLIKDDIGGMKDEHFSKKGTRVIADSIIKKISKDIEFNIINI